MLLDTKIIALNIELLLTIVNAKTSSIKQFLTRSLAYHQHSAQVQLGLR